MLTPSLEGIGDCAGLEEEVLSKSAVSATFGETLVSKAPRPVSARMSVRYSPKSPA